MNLTIAIIGTGKVARDSYLPHLSRRSGVSLLYYSRSRDKAEACARDFGGKVAASISELVAMKPDAVMILTGEADRYAVAKEVIAAKPRRIFFEKPLVAMRSQADVGEDDFIKGRELLTLAEAAGIETAMVFNYRFLEQTIAAHRIAAERGFGALVHADLLVHYACWSHCIDLLHGFGGRCAEITALSTPARQDGPASVAAAFRLAGGTSGTIQGTGQTAFDGSLYRLTLIFEKGRLELDDLDACLRVHQAGNRYAETISLVGNSSRWDQYRQSFERSIEAYLASIEQGAPPPIPGSAGLEELRFEAALRRAVASRRPVDVASEFPLTLAAAAR